jgi:hypothetical protein
VFVTENSPSFVGQTVNATIPIVRRRSPRDAAVLLGALRAHRDRSAQRGSPPEIEAEVRYEASLRRHLGEDFDGVYAEGLALDQPAMTSFALAQLDAVIGTSAADSP